jgi:uncharacterized protein YdaU (DUF1376 family)
MRDPAFLFYSKDWLSGCQFMDMQERGIYITLLAAQHQNGRLDPKRVGFLLGFSWDMVSDIVKSKFETDESGMLFNERLEEEILKRSQHSEKQRENGKKGGRPSKYKNPNETQTISQTEPKKKPLGNAIVNVNEIVVIEKGVQGEKQLTPEMLENIPVKVDEFEQRAIQDHGLFVSMKNNNKKLKSDSDCQKCILGFAARQRQGTDYYHAYQQFKYHLMNSTFYTTFDPSSKAQTKSGQALERDITKELKFDDNGNIIMTSI